MTSTLAGRGIRAGAGGRRVDAVFRAITLTAGLAVVAVLSAIGIFLLVQALPALTHDKGNFLTTRIWDPDGSMVFGIAALAFGTALSSVLALLIAVPIALGVALFIAEYAPRRLAKLFGYAVDMLATVPSVVYGLWAVYFLLKRMVPLQRFLANHLGWIPIFADPEHKAAAYSKSVFAAAVILAIMIIPIIAAVSRDVFTQVDPQQREAALALGATRWEMIRIAVLPPSRPGVSGAIMLGLGRALGETIAVALVIGATFEVNWRVLVPGGNTIAANIANRFAESGSLGRSALVASGLVLFAITLAVNLLARAIIYRGGAVERSAAT